MNELNSTNYDISFSDGVVTFKNINTTIAFVIGYCVWFVSNKVLGKNLKIARVIAATLVVTTVIYLLLGSLSYVLES